MFALWEINQMECEICSYLEWQLNVDPSTLRDFESRRPLSLPSSASRSPFVGLSLSLRRPLLSLRRPPSPPLSCPPFIGLHLSPSPGLPLTRPPSPAFLPFLPSPPASLPRPPPSSPSCASRFRWSRTMPYSCATPMPAPFTHSSNFALLHPLFVAISQPPSVGLSWSLSPLASPGLPSSASHSPTLLPSLPRPPSTSLSASFSSLPPLPFPPSPTASLPHFWPPSLGHPLPPLPGFLRCSNEYLERQLNVDPSTLRDFESHVCHDFAGPGPYPTVVLPHRDRGMDELDKRARLL
jgi:hypothetical protein